uniref:zona pellucida sperm-binding protein 3 isoform X2 n=1 Tax=Monopterus albus TaxID=43700 RepID=UPI0009B419EA|nr:zona pellucida sperm-binding protein 3-like isoform X2 [Monopterus albus]
MGLIDVGLLLLLFCLAYSYQFRDRAADGPLMQGLELDWAKTATEKGERRMPVPAPRAGHSLSGTGSSRPEAMKFFKFLPVPLSKDQKKVFEPGENSNTSLSDWAKSVLRGTPPYILKPERIGGETQQVEILCHLDRMYVRVHRKIFKTINAFKYLKLGTCPVNNANTTHYFLLYHLKTECGFKIENASNYVIISIELHYKPTTPVLREMPFHILLKCKIPRLMYSYAYTSLYPIIEPHKIFKVLNGKRRFALLLQDASGNEITGSETYTLGQPVYFGVKELNYTGSSEDRRMYITKCFVTHSRDPSAYPKYVVIDNHGMVTEQSRFLPGPSNMAVKFSVGTMIFSDVVSNSSQGSAFHLFMHCVVDIRSLTPTRISKACNYDQATKKWKELYGEDSVCACCPSACPPAQPKASRKIISSRSVNVNFSSKDQYLEADPVEVFNLEDPNMMEQDP